MKKLFTSIIVLISTCILFEFNFYYKTIKNILEYSSKIGVNYNYISRIFNKGVVHDEIK